MRRTFDQLEWLFLNLLAIAAANAVLDVIEEEALCDRVNVLGEKRLEALKADVPEIAEVRGPGFMVAAEFCHADGTPAPELTNTIREEALARGLLLLTCGVYGNVIRFLAPITIEDEVFAEALDILEAAIKAAKGH
ncbi:aminotransferase class III-fold pyridoxal phosphate-dependent enzyme [Celeribacter halophilus]|nr:aminotransferase class III-fold pyridoxal phosphate-dependent enzyme [Celeribacter halophilus]